MTIDKRLWQICGWALAAMLFGLAIHTPATIWMGTMLPDGLDVIIKAWKEVLMVAVALVVTVLVVRDGDLRRRLASDRLFWLMKGYAWLHIIMLAVYWQGWWPSVAGLMIDLRYLLAFMLVYVVVAAYPPMRRYLLGAIAVGAVIIIGFATVQHALPHDALKAIGYGPDTVVPYLTVDQNYDYIRLSSTMRGPNPMGAYAASVVLVVLALAWAGRLRDRLMQLGAGLLTVLAAIALWFSYSRSAKLALLAGLVVLAIVLQPWRRIPKQWLVSAGVFVAVAMLAAGVALSQTAFFSNVVLHTNPEGGSTTQSNDEHLSSLIDGSERMLAQPFGAGVGSTGSASLFGDQPLIIENQYLFIAHEVGWLGLGLFVAITVMVLWRLYRLVANDPWAAGVLASGVGLVAVGLVLPVWVDDVVSIVWWSLAAVVLAGGGSAAKANKRYTKKHAGKRTSD